MRVNTYFMRSVGLLEDQIDTVGTTHIEFKMFVPTTLDCHIYVEQLQCCKISYEITYLTTAGRT